MFALFVDRSFLTCVMFSQPKWNITQFYRNGKTETLLFQFWDFGLDANSAYSPKRGNCKFVDFLLASDFNNTHSLRGYWSNLGVTIIELQVYNSLYGIYLLKLHYNRGFVLFMLFT